jgi:D-alanyl-lipoteichoic acid acyltransferase DltB (MBOAT superfamily)
MYFLDHRFLVCIPIVVGLYWLSGNRLRNWVLLAANAAWLGVFSPATLITLAVLTVAIVYPATWIVAGARDREPASRRRWLVASGIGALILVISWARIGPHIPAIDPANSYIGEQLLHCIGVSYFLLKAVHAIIATASGVMTPPSLLALLQYVLFLPTVTSGPIYRLDVFTTQRETPKRLTWDHIHDGVLRVTLGIGKKIVAVPYLKDLFDSLHARELAYQPAAFVALYALLFVDFSGYSDIAIGLGRLLGFDVPENFKKPFSSTTLTQFWRNWHASLGDWLRENVFIPLGGIRAKGPKLAIIVVACMLLVGIWHAYSAVFLLWGLYHGVLLLIEHRLGLSPLRRHQTPWWRMALRFALIQAAVIGGMFAFLGRA